MSRLTGITSTETSATPSASPAADPSWSELLAAPDTFPRRHLGSDAEDIAAMVRTVGVASLDELIDQTVPPAIRRREPLRLSIGGRDALSESEALEHLRGVAGRNQRRRALLGQGYADTIVPGVLQRNILENPGWYTQYTPYQAEISQGRLEALLNYQTMIADLTGLPVANASLLDEATAAAESMHLAHAVAGEDRKTKRERTTFAVSVECHPHSLAVVRTRAEALGIQVAVFGEGAGDLDSMLAGGDVFGVLFQNPTTDGRVCDLTAPIARAQAVGALAVVACDLLALVLTRSPGEMGADVAIGSAQRFGVPLGFGGPHAAFFATREDHKRQIPGRLIGVSKDAAGNRALRMALQTREQHIRREKATSNICTAQVLLAILAGFYAVYHGPRGLRRIAQRVHALTGALAAGLRAAGYELSDEPFFDTLRVGGETARLREAEVEAERRGYDLRRHGDGALGVSLDEVSTVREVEELLEAFGVPGADVATLAAKAGGEWPLAGVARAAELLEHPVFHRHHTEHEMLRYVRRLEARDLSLTRSMIPLGSCTMKLNATAEMTPISWPEFARLHPFAPASSSLGYAELFGDLERWLCEITGFAGCSLQPNAGSQGEYAGLLVVRAYHAARGEGHRTICLIPVSAHGTNPASAVMAGMRVVPVACDDRGNVDLADLEARAAEHASNLAALMVTYPSTHGVFEEQIREICAVVHRHGGQVYMDGANMNAQVGLCRPGDFGADVCHLNLHKTFCIPHGGGGPGMGPICVAEHLRPFLPGHTISGGGGEQAIGAVSAAAWGSASILPIPWMYIAMMGGDGLRRATELAILNANYMATRLGDAYPVLYRGARGRCAHEFILDLRPFKESAGVEAEDVAKRLMDYGFHAPTMSFPVAGTLMIEPTESESKAELDRLCDALLAIREEIRAVEEGRADRQDNPLKHAPHTAAAVSASVWPHAYSREEAAFPAPWVRESKFWPSVARIDNAWGDRNLMCLCPPVEAYA
jgi:glycine dehydrogenase